jgi:hypothetical protein
MVYLCRFPIWSTSAAFNSRQLRALCGFLWYYDSYILSTIPISSHPIYYSFSKGEFRA